ncbi:hypothetical protein MicvaDRAFT_3916 [Microcoleus vaginatus FGP-2]|nr:hypothetical protein MicvaDRAFT_3916 [Microcoleus vaginatus FGP-2]
MGATNILRHSQELAFEPVLPRVNFIVGWVSYLARP